MCHEPVVYAIRVRGPIDRRWSDWFDGMEILPAESGDAVLVGPVVDQTALHGLLARIRDLNLTLVGLQRMSDS